MSSSKGLSANRFAARQTAPRERGSGDRRRIVIVGGGFGGIAAARRLGGGELDLTLVDRTNHQLFQPLLYQVATGALSEGECATPIRTMLRRHANTTVLMAEVTDIDAERRLVALDTGERLDYDSLILAGGAETSYFGRDEWADVTFGLKTLSDAVALRDRVFGAFEQAERASDQAEREEWLTFVVVGGGATGVEISGQLAILARDVLERDFSRIDTGLTKIVLVDAGGRLVPAFSESLSAKAAEGLASLGVTVREGVKATSIDRRGIEVELGTSTERIAARTVIWAAGVRAAGLGGILAGATRTEVDRGGRVEVREDCTVPGHPEISVIGDMASHPGDDGQPLPGLATVAIQQARHVADAIRSGQPGASTPFRYLDKGSLAVIGRGRAVCEVRGRQVSGRLAFYMYLSIHLYYLGGAPGHRLGVLGRWISARMGNLGERIIEGELAAAGGAAHSRSADPSLPGEKI